MSVLKDAKVLTCGVEKNGITVLNWLIALAAAQPFHWFPLNPKQVGLSYEAFVARLGKYACQMSNLESCLLDCVVLMLGADSAS